MRKSSLLAALTIVTSSTPLAAQWESPTFFSPRPGEDLGIYAISPAGLPEWGIAAIWRQEGNLNLGVRLGLEDEDFFHVGAEFYGPLNIGGPQSPLLLSWLLGLGASFNDITWLRVPAGVSIGMNLGSPGSVQLKPYVFPRLALDLFVTDTPDGEETETEFNFDFDLGVDLPLGESFVLRAGATISVTDRGYNSFGAGIAYRMSRRVTVR